MSHVFISYEKTDRAVADQICQYLEEQGLQCWIAPRNVLAGKEWDVSITEAIKTAGCLVLVFSSHSDSSRQVKREVTIADNHEVPIIPCRIRNEEPANLAYFLTIAHWFDAFESSLEHHLPQLLATIRSHVPDLQGKPPPTETPEPPSVKPIAPEKKKGRLSVNTEPQNATLKILNLRAQFTQGMELEPGSYHVEVSADGFKRKREWVELEAGEEKHFSIKLTEIKAPATPQPQAAAEIEVQALEEFTNILGMNFVLIPAGTFMMGSPPDEGYRFDNEKQHQVTISQAFYLETTPVTQGQWEKVMVNNPSHFKECGEDCPVESVSWDDSQEFIKKLNHMEKTNKYRLPTEAELEYACRADSKGRWSFGDDEADLGKYAWYDGNSGNQTQSVGQLKPNAWGLCDMHGNVCEWCQDWYVKYSPWPLTDPKGGPEPWFLIKRFHNRVLRGGSWYRLAGYTRSASRSYFSQDCRSFGIGFRVARAL